MATQITTQDVYNATGVEDGASLMKAIRNSSSQLFQAHVPLPNAENVQQVGAGLTRLDVVQNEFIATLVDRIGKVVIKYKSFNNPLSMFKRGDFPLGRTIEEIWVDIAEEHTFDPDASVTNVFRQEKPDVLARFHEINREGYYKQTIQEAWLEKAFTSWDKFSEFVAGVMNAIYAADEIGEFEYMKLLITNYYNKELFKEIVVGEINSTNVKPFVQTVKGTSNMIEFPSREYNAAGVMQSTQKGSQYVIIDALTDAAMDTEVLASAFNMDKVTFLGHKIVIDKFHDPNIVAVMVDAEWFMVYDKLYKMTSLYNPEGLYWNYWLHHHQLLSTSQFSNAIAFVREGSVPVESVEFASTTSDLIVGAEATTNITFNPDTATNQNGGVYSTNESVATVELVTQDGSVTGVKVTAVGVGQALVVFKSTSGGKETTLLVTVTTDPATV